MNSLFKKNKPNQQNNKQCILKAKHIVLIMITRWKSYYPQTTHCLVLYIDDTYMYVYILHVYIHGEQTFKDLFLV